MAWVWLFWSELPAGEGRACLAGEGACPPEDCGGVYGFAELKEVLAAPDSAERDEMLEWVDEDFDPAHLTWPRPGRR